MQLHNLKSYNRKYKKTRVGRGGKRGTTSGKGTKGQKARAGRRIRPAGRDFIQRLPKLRGFKQHSTAEIKSVVNVGDLNRVQGTLVNPEALVKAGLVKDGRRQVKVLADGEVDRAYTLEGVQVSKAAKTKLEKAGGKMINQ